MANQSININLIPDGVTPVAKVSQYDVKRTIVFHLYQGTAAYSIPNGTTIQVRGMKGDNCIFIYSQTDKLPDNTPIVSYSGSTITLNTSMQMTAATGDCITQFRLLKNAEELATLNFIMSVQLDPAATGDASQSELPAIITMATEQMVRAEQAAAATVAIKNDSEAWAVGKRDGTDVPSTDPAYHNNSKYYSEQAVTSATNAGLSATAAEGSAEDAEAYAVGTRDGAAVPSTDPAYHNNSKYYSDLASSWASHPPYVGDNGDWYVYDPSTQQFVDTGIDASITMEISDITMLNYGATPTVTNSGTSTDAVFHLGIPRAATISSVQKTSTSGLVDTYTMTLQDGTTFTYQVTNGADGQGAVDSVNNIAPIGGNVTLGLGDIDGVNFSTLADGNVLIYDLATNKWVNGLIPTGGHTIENSSGTSMTQRGNLKFTGNVSVTDDSAGDATVVNVTGGGHTILDSNGTAMTQRANLQFDGFAVEDDAQNNKTIVKSTIYVNKPTITGNSFREDGTAQGPTIVWNPASDAQYCNITNATAINAGTYTLTIGLKSTATSCWNDGTTTDITFQYTILPSFLNGWLTAGGLDPTYYSDLDDVFADEKAVRRLFTIHDSVDYLVSNYGVDTDTDADIETIINNDYCAKWINLRDYALDTLYSDSDIAALMDTADKYFYGEWALVGQVPTMTSNTAPSGVASASSSYGSAYDAWKAFKGVYNSNEDKWSTAFEVTNANITYQFVSATCVDKVGFVIPLKYDTSDPSTHAVDFQFKVQASNDGSTYADLGQFSVDTTGYIDEKLYFDFNNSNSYLYYRIQFLSNNIASNTHVYCTLTLLQFYKWQPKGNVPVMTSNTAPYGEAVGTTAYSSNPLWYAFDGNESTSYNSNNTGASNVGYAGYKFTNPVNVRRVRAYIGDYSGTSKTIGIRYSDDGTNWTEAKEFTDDGTIKNNIVNVPDSGYHLYWCAYLKSAGSSIRVAYTTLQFYGRELKVSVPTMTSNTAPYGEASASSVYADDYAWKGFNSSVGAWMPAQNSTNDWLQYEFTSPVCIKGYYINCTGSGSITVNFKIQGYDGSDWIDLASIDSVVPNTNRNGYIDHSDSYKKYRIFTQNAMYSSNHITIAYMQFYGLDYSEYDWDTDNPRHYIYDHGVEPNETLTYLQDANGYCYIEESTVYYGRPAYTEVSPRLDGIRTQLDLTSYNLGRMVCGNKANSWYTIQLDNGSGSTPYISKTLPISSKYNDMVIDLSSVNGQYYFGSWTGASAIHNSSVEELWLE